MNDTELLAFHRELVAIPSVSGDEERIASFVHETLVRRGVAVARVGNNVVATCGSGPVVCLNSHLDTVPPAVGWSRDPFHPDVQGGRVHGLGSNDAKASVAALVAAFICGLCRSMCTNWS